MNKIDKMGDRLIKKTKTFKEFLNYIGDWKKRETRLKWYNTYTDNLKNNLTEAWNKIKELDSKLETLEDKRRATAGKAGGLQRSVNNLERKNKELKEELKTKDLELKTRTQEIKILRSSKKDVEEYKNYFECRKELEKRSKNK